MDAWTKLHYSFFTWQEHQNCLFKQMHNKVQYIKACILLQNHKKNQTLLLKPYAHTVFKIYAKVRKSAQFEILTYEACFSTLNICWKSLNVRKEWYKISIRTVYSYLLNSEVAVLKSVQNAAGISPILSTVHHFKLFCRFYHLFSRKKCKK